MRMSSIVTHYKLANFSVQLLTKFHQFHCPSLHPQTQHIKILFAAAGDCFHVASQSYEKSEPT